MRSLFLSRILLIVIAAQMGTQLVPKTADAALVHRVAMIFEQPSETSKQLLIIDEGGHPLVVTGSATMNAEVRGSPSKRRRQTQS